VLSQTIKTNQIKEVGYGRLESNADFVKPQKLMDYNELQLEILARRIKIS